VLACKSAGAAVGAAGAPSLARKSAGAGFGSTFSLARKSADRRPPWHAARAPWGGKKSGALALALARLRGAGRGGGGGAA
jgi:hypothetical protein